MKHNSPIAVIPQEIAGVLKQLLTKAEKGDDQETEIKKSLR